MPNFAVIDAPSIAKMPVAQTLPMSQQALACGRIRASPKSITARHCYWLYRCQTGALARKFVRYSRTRNRCAAAKSPVAITSIAVVNPEIRVPTAPEAKFAALMSDRPAGNGKPVRNDVSNWPPARVSPFGTASKTCGPIGNGFG